MNILLVTAMPKEAKKIIEQYNLKQIKENFYQKENISLVITDVGRNNVTISLFNLSKEYNMEDAIIINIGLVGSNNLKVGDVIEVKKSYGYHFDLTPFGDELYTTTNSPYQLDKITNLKQIDCYTSDGFVLETNITETCVFDMELNTITLFPHKKLHSIKIVSDTLNADSYKELNYDNAIENALEHLDKIINSYQN
jgi:nucleoside phosphorylase